MTLSTPQPIESIGESDKLAILIEFDTDPQRMAAEIGFLRQRLAEAWEMATRHHKTALKLSHAAIHRAFPNGLEGTAE